MGVKNYAELTHIVPLHWGANSSTGVATKFVQLKTFHKVQFIACFGTMGSANYDVKVQAGTAADGSSATDLAFEYRKTATAGTDTMGTLTEVAAGSAVTMAQATDSGKLLIIDVDSSELTAAKPYVGLHLTRGDSATAQILVLAILYPRYPQKTGSGAVS